MFILLPGHLPQCTCGCTNTVVSNKQFYLNSHQFFKDFSLENGDECKYDYVLVELGFKDAEKKICGENPSEAQKVQISRLNKMVIRFWTDTSHGDRGFRAVYKTGKHTLTVLIISMTKLLDAD